MNDAKFRKEVALVVKWLEALRTMTDESDKRILRDFIRDLVKELTRPVSYKRILAHETKANQV